VARPRGRGSARLRHPDAWPAYGRRGMNRSTDEREERGAVVRSPLTSRTGYYDPAVTGDRPARFFLVVLSATSITSWTHAALAQEKPLAPVTSIDAARTAIRIAGTLDFLGPVGVGVELSQRVLAHGGLDALVSYEDLQHDHSGVSAEVLARYHPFSGPHALSLGVGPALLLAREYGGVAFVTGEVAYEFRKAGATSVLVGVGMQVALNNSGRATCPDQGLLPCFLWTDHYQAGDVGFRLRLAIGTAF